VNPCCQPNLAAERRNNITKIADSAGKTRGPEAAKAFARGRRPIELNVDWAADSKAVPLAGGLTRIKRSGTTGEEISRAGFACRNIRIGDN